MTDAPLWESTSRRIRQDTWSWLQSHIVAWILAFIAPGGGAVLAALFASPATNPKLAALFGFIGGVAGLALLVGGAFAAQSVLVFRKERDEARKLCEPAKELANIKSGDTVTEKDINVPWMFQQLKANHLDVVTFDHCILRGPCLIVPEGRCEFYRCDMASNADSGATLIKREIGLKYYGVATFVHCTFSYCNFDNVSFLLYEREIESFLSRVPKALGR